MQGNKISKIAKITLFDNQACTEKQMYELENPSIGGTVYLSCMKWENLDCSSIMHKVKQWDIDQSLNLNSNKQPQIIVELAHIKFPYLKAINFQYNYIRCIEKLASLQAPFLQRLNLNNNHICTVRNLIKCHFPQLKVLELSGNKIIELNDLAKMMGKNMRKLIIQSEGRKRCQSEDLRWFQKLEPYGIFQTFCNQQNNSEIKSFLRIRIHVLRGEIIKKYPYISQ